MVVGRSRTLDGEFLDQSGRKMKEGYATSVLSSNDGDRFFGPGHNGEIFTDRLGHDYIMYHCHDRSRGKDSERYLMLQRLFWDNDGWPYVKNGKPCAEGYVPEW